jgi:hypothetical protein
MVVQNGKTAMSANFSNLHIPADEEHKSMGIEASILRQPPLCSVN